MKGQRSRGSSALVSRVWYGAAWMVIMAAALYGLYCLCEYRIMAEEQAMLLAFVAVPVVGFLLSGAGQDRSQAWESTPGAKDEPDGL